jgi:hypothetical protein
MRSVANTSKSPIPADVDRSGVQPGGSEPYQVEHRTLVSQMAIPGVQPDTEIDVWVDPTYRNSSSSIPSSRPEPEPSSGCTEEPGGLSTPEGRESRQVDVDRGRRSYGEVRADADQPGRDGVVAECGQRR